MEAPRRATRAKKVREAESCMRYSPGEFVVFLAYLVCVVGGIRREKDACMYVCFCVCIWRYEQKQMEEENIGYKMGFSQEKSTVKENVECSTKDIAERMCGREGGVLTQLIERRNVSLWMGMD
jgi:hypothetical protein